MTDIDINACMFVLARPGVLLENSVAPGYLRMLRQNGDHIIEMDLRGSARETWERGLEPFIRGLFADPHPFHNASGPVEAMVLVVSLDEHPLLEPLLEAAYRKLQ
jgi:hypothetical protein